MAGAPWDLGPWDGRGALACAPGARRSRPQESPGWKLPSGRRGRVRKASPPQPRWGHRGRSGCTHPHGAGDGAGQRGLSPHGAHTGSLGQPGAPGSPEHTLPAGKHSSQGSARAPCIPPESWPSGGRGQGTGTGQQAPLPQGAEAPPSLVVSCFLQAASQAGPPNPQHLLLWLSLTGNPSPLATSATQGSVIGPGGSVTRQLARAQSCGPQRPFP